MSVKDMWYPTDKEELNSLLDEFLKPELYRGRLEKVNGLIVPHAGYEYSGEIAGKAFSIIKPGSIKKAIVLGPCHYIPLLGVVSSKNKILETPLGKIKTFNEGFDESDISEEHSINNQVPFLQKIGIKEVMPVMVGKLTLESAREIAEKISNINALYVFSTDLSHFLPYEEAIERDRKTIEIIESLDEESFNRIDACGFYPLMILFQLCKIKGFKPRLVEYKNSGDIIGDRLKVVGYASFWF